MNTKSINVLLIDDSEEDVYLMKEALQKSQYSINLTVAENGVEGLIRLRVNHIDLVILDLNMPRMNGRQVLNEIKSDVRLRALPVVIFTTSRSRDDIMYCYTNYTNCYICKPIEIENYYRVVREIEKFWIEVAQLPKENGQSVNLR